MLAHHLREPAQHPVVLLGAIGPEERPRGGSDRRVHGQVDLAQTLGARVEPLGVVGGVVVGQCQSDGCVVWTDNEAVVLDGVQDLVVVRANGITLVTTRQRSTQLKELLGDLPDQIRRQAQ